MTTKNRLTFIGFLLLVVVTLLVAACLFGVASAHLCLLSPYQRGAACDVNVEVNACCGLGEVLGHHAPCGDMPVGNPVAELYAGQNYSLVFQKNENHFYASNPGSFSVNYWQGGEPTLLATIPDTNTPWSYVYTLDVSMPSTSGLGWLQVVYATNNPAVKNTNFYQCSDIVLN